MRTEAAGQRAHVLDGRVATLTDDVGRAECFTEPDAVGMVSEEDDLLGAAASGGDHAA